MEFSLNKEQIDKIVEYSLEAGEIAKDYFVKKNFEIHKKPDGSRVTCADVAVSKFFDKKLKASFPDISIICEEGQSREINGDLFWLIDPIDGTSSFASNSEQFAITIALLNKNKPIFGLIYAPMFEGGKMAFSDENNRLVINNFDEEKGEESSKKDILKIVASKRVDDNEVEKYIRQFHLDDLNNFEVEKLSSAIKYFRIIERRANIYLHPRPSMEWDTAGGQFLVELIGGKVKNLSFNSEGLFELENSMKYRKNNFLNQPFVAFI